MLAQAFESQFRDAEAGYRSPALSGLGDVDITSIREFTGLNVKVAIRQAGHGFHLGEGNRVTRYKRGEDAKAARGANDVIELEFHAGIYFINRSIMQFSCACQELCPGLAALASKNEV